MLGAGGVFCSCFTLLKPLPLRGINKLWYCDTDPQDRATGCQHPRGCWSWSCGAFVHANRWFKKKTSRANRRPNFRWEGQTCQKVPSGCRVRGNTKLNLWPSRAPQPKLMIIFSVNVNRHPTKTWIFNMTISDLCVENSDNKMRHFQTSRHSPLNRKVSLFRGLYGQWRTTKVNDRRHVTLTPLPHEAALFRNRFAFESVKDSALCQAQYVHMLLFEYLAFSLSSLQSYLHNFHTATGCCIDLHLTLGSEPRSTKWFSISCIFFFSLSTTGISFFFFSYKSTPNYRRQKIIAALLHDDYRATVCEHMFSTVINTKCHFNSSYNHGSFMAAGRMTCCQQLLSLYTHSWWMTVGFFI